MKTVLIIDHGERCPEDAVNLLRASGYAVEMPTPEEALRSGPEAEASRRVPGEQQRIHEELLQANLVVENSPVVLFRWRAEEGWPVDLVSANVSRFGYAKEELLNGAVPFSSLVHPDDLERVALEIAGYAAAGVDNFQQEYRIITKGGEARWIFDRTLIERDAEGVVTHYQGIVFDITERKRAEEALRESEDWLRSVFLVAPVGIGVVRDRLLLTVNSRLCEMTGYTREELEGRNALMLYPDQQEFERVGRDKYRQISEKGTGAIETRWRKKDGTLIDILLASTPMHPPDLSKGVTFTALDITERKRAEEKLRQSEAKFSSAFLTSPDSVNINRLEDGLFLDVNEGFCTITGYQPEEVIGRTSQELGIWLNREDRERLVREINRCGCVSDLEAEFRRKDGSVLTGQMSARVIEIEGEPCIVNIVRDITEKRRVEELMRASLEEKTVLLQEIHHRVKNNLQIISSLLELQSGLIIDENFRRYVLDSQNRIMAMALVHEKLFHSECFASINFGDYIDDLAHSLFAGYVKDSELIGILVDAGDFSLGIDEAIPCGLIVNELVSNSLKHAFPDGRSGEIKVLCHAGADGLITLKVSDTGIGLPPGLDFGTAETLGLQLVTMLVKQLRGTVGMNSGQSGTVFDITFPGCLQKKIFVPGRDDCGSHSTQY
jgi:PAS domain S-box-containing protein